MTIVVTSSVLEVIMAEARAAHPQEACGLLFGSHAAITAFKRAANVHPMPETHFEIDPHALIDAHRSMRQGGARLVGYFHSHPRGPAEPSATDCEQAARDGMIWAIAGDDGLRFWRSQADGFSALSYTAV